MSIKLIARAGRRLATVITLVVLAASTAVAQPGPTDEHKILQKDVGSWDANIKIWPQPDAEPMQSTGTEKNEMIGDMWIVSRFDGKIGDMSFTGSGVVGYDPAEKKYVGTWIDSMTPSLTVMKGDYDAAKKTMTMTGDMRDHASGKTVKTKQVSRYTDDDTRVFEMYMPGEGGGKEWKMMEIEYKRRK